MSSLTRRTFLLAVVAGCSLLSLRPPTAAERGLEVALAPVRLLSELAVPVGLLRRRAVRAAERQVRERFEQEQAARQRLGADRLRFVLPDEAPLRRGRAFVAAEVVRRVPRDVDRLEVRVLAGGAAARAGLEVGLPAVVGNHYVGRVSALTPGGAIVDLVTRSDGFVGGVVPHAEGRARMVVGGVRPREVGGERLLAVRSPERPVLEPGEVRVEDALSGDPHAALAGGFVLGTLVVVDDQREERTYGVRSPVNFAAGIFQLALVLPGGGGQEDGWGAERDALSDGRWRAARVLSCGDPLGLREGVVLGAGSLQGVSAGAAVVAGARLVGRVGRVGPLQSGARLLGDPGLALPVAAQVEGLEHPLVLGWLVSLGRAEREDGRAAVLFHWQQGWPSDEAGPLEGTDPVQALLYTGAGAAGVPPWLVIGDALLPRGRGPQVIEVRLDVDPGLLGHVRLRLEEGAAP
jgi:hypothetical protein